MSSKLKSNNYGKSNVRILKVKRDNSIHNIVEMKINVQFKGDFDNVHLNGDNSNVLPTDTIKNTLYILAKENDINSVEEFIIYAAQYFYNNNEQISEVKINAEEKIWKRINVSSDDEINSAFHDHSFICPGLEVRTCKVKVGNDKFSIRSGLKDLLVLKTTCSGFEGYIKDKYTTLPETDDRVFSTSIKAEWKFKNSENDYIKIFNEVRRIIINTFADHDSLSVQHTLYECGKKVVEQCPAIKQIFLSMPNKHYLKFDLDRFGIENNNEIFIPTDEPFGLIEGVIKN
ncbi:MAG TPA: urate oxidase [Ignavibacteria bacterium]|nr:urate oxidase [Ignavibacteria bacterium]HRA99609.1 urate oxidase [Ignavibacteria bacterium]